MVRSCTPQELPQTNPSKGIQMKDVGLKQLRWHPKPCALGVSGTAKLFAEYDEDDKHHKGSIAAIVKELTNLAITKNYYITRDKLMQMYDDALQLTTYKP